jgi:hypothetical protein
MYTLFVTIYTKSVRFARGCMRAKLQLPYNPFILYITWSTPVLVLSINTFPASEYKLNRGKRKSNKKLKPKIPFATMYIRAVLVLLGMVTTALAQGGAGGAGSCPQTNRGFISCSNDGKAVQQCSDAGRLSTVQACSGATACCKVIFLDGPTCVACT